MSLTLNDLSVSVQTDMRYVLFINAFSKSYNLHCN